MFRSLQVCVCLLWLGGTATALSSSGDVKNRRVFVGTPVTQQPNRWVEECMTCNPVTLDVSTPTDEAIAFLLNKGLSGVPIVNENRALVGMLSSYDFLQKQAFGGALLNMEGTMEQVESYVEAAKKIGAQRVEEVMTPKRKVVTVAPSTTMRDAAILMSQQKLHHLPVVKNEEVVGILTSSDIMKDLLHISKNLPEAKEEDNNPDVSP